MNGPRKEMDTTLRRCLICFNSNKISSSDIHYFQLPSDPVVAAQWFRNLNRNELVKHLFQKNYTTGIWICSEHFPKHAICIKTTHIGKVVTLVPGTLPLIVKPGKRKPPPVLLSSAARNLLFCRQTPVETELKYFRLHFEKYQHFQHYRIHCTTCDAHINLAPINKDQIQVHGFLKVIQCDECFYHDGKSCPLPMNKDLIIQCQCGVANTLVKCYCTAIFCKICYWKDSESTSKCLWCTPAVTLDLRALQWAVFKVLDFKYKTITTNDKYKDFSTERIQKLLEKDLAGCCGNAAASSGPSKSATTSEVPPIVPPQPLVPSQPVAQPQSVQTPSSSNIEKQVRSPETMPNNSIPTKKFILSNSVGQPTVMDKMQVVANVGCVQNAVGMPPLTPITKVIVSEKLPIINNVPTVVSIGGHHFTLTPNMPIIQNVTPSVGNTIAVPVVQMPLQIPVQMPMQIPVQMPVQMPIQMPVQTPVQIPAQIPVPTPIQPTVKLLPPIKCYTKPKKTTKLASSTGILTSQSNKKRSKPALDDRCLEIKSNFKNNGTFLKTLCDHFMFRVENMQKSETSKSNALNLHQQLISAIGDICDKLESVKEKCMEDLQKCGDDSTVPIQLPPISEKDDDLNKTIEAKCVEEVPKSNEHEVTGTDGCVVPSSPAIVLDEKEEDIEVLIALPIEEPIGDGSSGKEVEDTSPKVVPNDEEEDEEELYELYDIVDIDVPECDVSIINSDLNEAKTAEA